MQASRALSTFSKSAFSSRWMSKKAWVCSMLVLGTGAALLPDVAAAQETGLAACGNINVQASAMCQVSVEGGCEAQCTPINCSVTAFADCQGGCQASVSAECEARIDVAECMAQCEVDPGRFDCSASCSAGCEVDCGASCEARCEANSDQASCMGECQASCNATCSGECSARCDVEPPEASCEARCEATVEGRCRADANFDCQIDCQAGLTAECVGGCMAECQTPEGALFCDSQYIDHDNNLEDCIRALNARLNVEVDASSSAACGGGSCSAEASGSVSSDCSVSPGRRSEAPLLAWLALLGTVVARVRRRPRRFI